MANETKIVITAATAQAEASLAKLGQSVGSMSRQMFDLSGVVGTLGGALTVTAFAGIIKSSIDAADHLNDLSQKTGTSVEALAGLKFAADQNGTSLEAVANASKKLSTALAENPDVLKKFGITAKDSTGALVQLADIFASMPDGVNKTALAVKLMGKSGEEMIPFLNQGSTALRDMVEEGKRLNPITAEMAKQADQFNDDLARLKMQAGGLGIVLANELLPSLADTAAEMSKAASEGNKFYAVLRGIAGVGKLPFDLILGDADKIDLSSATRLNELKSELAGIENNLKRTGGREGLIGKWLHGSREEQLAQAEILKNQIATIEKFGAQLDKKPEAPAAPKKDGAQGRALYGALGGDGKTKKHETPLDHEAEVQQKIEDARVANRTKWLEKQEQDYARSVEEANRIIFDIDPIAKASAEWEKLLALKEQGLLTDEQIAKSYQKTFGDVSKAGEDSFQSLESAVRGWGNAFTDEMAKMVRTGKLDFKSLADSIINDLIRIQIQKNVTEPLMKSGTSWLDGLFKGIGGGGGGSGSSSGFVDTGGFSQMLASANGNVFSGAGIGAYSGSVVDKPTLFPFARGVGLMGEAGPEAILPLTRINGKLGVQAQGGGSAPNVTVNVVNQSGKNLNARQQGEPQFDGRGWVLGIVLDAADSDPNFRNAMGMA